MSSRPVSFSNVQEGGTLSDPLLSASSLETSVASLDVIEAELKSKCGGFSNGVRVKCELIRSLEACKRKVRSCLDFVYSYRSCTKTFFQHGKGWSPPQIQQFIRTKLSVLEAEIKALYDLYADMMKCVKQVASAVRHIHANREFFSLSTSTQSALALAEVLAGLLDFDVVKGSKVAIQNDLRVFQDLAVSIQEWELSEYTEELSSFFRSPYVAILGVQSRLRDIEEADECLSSVLSSLLHLIAEEESNLSQYWPVKMSILKATPVAIFFLCSHNMKHTESKNVAKAVAVIKGYPVLPVLGDTWMTTFGLLTSLKSFESKFKRFGPGMMSELSGRELAEVQVNVDIANFAQVMKINYKVVLFDLCKYIHQLEKLGRENDHIPSTLANGCSIAYKSCLDFLNECNCQLQCLFYWKMSFKQPMSSLIPQDVSDDSLRSRITVQFSEKEKVAILCLIDVMRNLNQFIESKETILRPAVLASAYYRIQLFSEKTVGRAFKAKVKNKKEVHELIELLDTLASFQKSKAESGSDNGIKLGVGPSISQLFLMIELTSDVIHLMQNSKKKKLFADNTGFTQTVQDFTSFSNDCLLFSFLLKQGLSLKSCFDTSFLWLHEQLFDVMAANRNSITTSLPWLLCEAQLNIPPFDLDIETVLAPLFIYNEAAYKNFESFKRKHIHDELEGEVDLAFDRLSFNLGTKIYDIGKTVASAQYLDQYGRYLKGQKDIRLPKRSSLPILTSKVHKLLGRYVNLRKMVAQRINKLFRENLDYLMERFEAHDISQGMVEFHTGYIVLERTHCFLKECIADLDSWGAILHEMNDATSAQTFATRMGVLIYGEIEKNVSRHFTYFLSASMFVENANADKTDLNKLAMPVLPSQSLLFGNRFYNEVVRDYTKAHAGKLGVFHFECMSSVLSEKELFWLSTKLTERVCEVFRDSLLPFLVRVARSVPQEIAAVSVQIDSIDAIFRSLKPVLDVLEREIDTSLPAIFSDMRAIGNMMMVIWHLDSIQRSDDTLQTILYDSASHGISMAKSFEVGDGSQMTSGSQAVDLHVVSKVQKQTAAAFKRTLSSVRETFQEVVNADEHGHTLACVCHALELFLCVDHMDVQQNEHNYGDSVMLTMAVTAGVLCPGQQILKWIQVISERYDNSKALPGHITKLVENAKCYHKSWESFQHVILS